MQLTVRLIIIFSILLSIQASFSQTCYKAESYCSQYGVTEFNCRAESYNPHSCQVYGSYTVYVPKTCYKSECSIQNVCGWGWRYRCDTGTFYDTCYKTCYYNVYKKCWHFEGLSLKNSIHSSCGVDYTVPYSCNPYSCNPHQVSYNCGNKNVYVCEDNNVCNTVPYDCSYYETKTGLHDSTCYDSKPVCDTATDYDNCLTWGERQVPYDCTEMKLINYGISSSNGKVGESLLATFNISDCTGTIQYELYLKNTNIKGAAACGLNNIELLPVSAGTQVILLKLKDDRTNITKTIGTIIVTNPNGQMDSANPFIPAGETFTKNVEAGTYDNKIMELLNQGLGNEDIIKNLMLTIGAVGLAITATQANRIKSYIETLRNKRDNIFANQQKQAMIDKLNLYQNNFFTKKYLYELQQAQLMQQLSSTSTYYKIPQQITSQEVNNAKTAYENYLNLLLNDSILQAMGKKERENANLLEEYKKGVISAFIENGFQTATGMIASAGISYIIASAGVCLNPIGGVICAASGTAGILLTISEAGKKEKYANLIAYLYGINSEEYKQARNGQITFYTQTGLNIISTIGGAYYGNKAYVVNQLRNANYYDDILINDNGEILGFNQDNILINTAANAFPEEAYIFNNGKLLLNGNEVLPETVFDTFYDEANNRYLEMQLGTSENNNGLMHLFKDHNSKEAGYNSPTEMIKDIKLSMKNYILIDDMGDSWRYVGGLITTPNGQQMKFVISWSKIHNNLQTGWLK